MIIKTRPRPIKTKNKMFATMYTLNKLLSLSCLDLVSLCWNGINCVHGSQSKMLLFLYAVWNRNVQYQSRLKSTLLMCIILLYGKSVVFIGSWRWSIFSIRLVSPEKFSCCCQIWVCFIWNTKNRCKSHQTLIKKKLYFHKLNNRPYISPSTYYWCCW